MLRLFWERASAKTGNRGGWHRVSAHKIFCANCISTYLRKEILAKGELLDVQLGCSKHYAICCVRLNSAFIYQDKDFSCFQFQQLESFSGVQEYKMAPFNFAQRSSSRTAMPRDDHSDLKLEKMDLHAPVSTKDAGLPPAAGRYAGKPPHLSGTFEPSKAFVRQLATKSEYRSVPWRNAPSVYLCYQVDGGRSQTLSAGFCKCFEAGRGAARGENVSQHPYTADLLQLGSSDAAEPLHTPALGRLEASVWTYIPQNHGKNPDRCNRNSLLTRCRRHLAGLLKEHSLVEGGDLQVATWIKDEGFDTTIPSVMQVGHLTSQYHDHYADTLPPCLARLPAVSVRDKFVMPTSMKILGQALTWLCLLTNLQALENAKSNDLLFWASRYNLFVLWSADRTHPWDSLPGAANHATLEIGKQRGSDSEVSSQSKPHTLHASVSKLLRHAWSPKDFLKLCCVSAVCWPQVVVLLNGKPITDYTFKSGVLKTT